MNRPSTKYQDTYHDLAEKAEKFIAQGYSEDLAFEMAAIRCEDIDQLADEESLQWD